MFRHLQSVMDLRIVVEKLRPQHRFDLLVAGTCSSERHDAYSAAKLVAYSVVQLVQQQLLCVGGSWEGSAVIMCIQQFSDGSLRRGTLRVARIVIGEIRLEVDQARSQSRKTDKTASSDVVCARVNWITSMS
jgi:hypothetical protein